MKTICPKCGMEYDLDDSMAGIKVECECGEKWVVEFHRENKKAPIVLHKKSRKRKWLWGILVLIALILYLYTFAPSKKDPPEKMFGYRLGQDARLIPVLIDITSKSGDIAWITVRMREEEPYAKFNRCELTVIPGEDKKSVIVTEITGWQDDNATSGEFRDALKKLKEKFGRPDQQDSNSAYWRWSFEDRKSTSMQLFLGKTGTLSLSVSN